MSDSIEMQAGQYEAVDRDRMSETEADQVVALWARMQEKNAAEMGMPSVKVLSEALGTDEGTVRRLLAEVRGEVEAKGEVEPAAEGKRNGKVFAVVGAVIIVVALSLIAFASARQNSMPQMGSAVAFDEGMPTVAVPMSAPTAPATVAITDSAAPTMFQDSELLPAGSVLRVDGVPLRGTGGVHLQTESNVADGLKRLYDKVTVEQKAIVGEISGQGVYEAIQANRPVDGVVSYVDAMVDLGGQKMNVKLPICHVADSRIESIVLDDVRVKIEKMAKWAYSVLK